MKIADSNANTGYRSVQVLGMMAEVKWINDALNNGWFGVVVTALVTLTKLSYVEPG